MAAIKERAMDLLSAGVIPDVVATTCGVTPSYISQLLAEEEFAKELAERKYVALQSHNKRDNRYDEIEDKLLDKLENTLPLMNRPTQILAAIKTINGATRRGKSAPQSITTQQTIVNLTIPTAIANTFEVNTNNQIIKVGDQDLVTIQSGALTAKLKPKEDTKCIE